jgi:cell division protein FtsI/penicillin-binding protein 2
VRVGALSMTQAVAQLVSDGPVGLTYVAMADDGFSGSPRGDAPARPVDPDAADAVLAGMSAAVSRGTAVELGSALPGLDLAAKTGSAETVRDGVPVTDSWVTVVLDRRYVVTVLVRGAADDPDPAARHAAFDVAIPVLRGLA